MKNNSTLSRLGALLAVTALALTGCAANPAAPASDPTPAGDSVTMTDAWVKAAESGMSAGFGTLVNDGDADVTVVSAETEAAGMVELHETVENEAGELVMREVSGGFSIAAGEKLTLEPGANHLMLMQLAGPLQAGEELTFTLTFSDESTYTFTAPVKDYTGANENYEGDDEMDMDH